MDKKTPSTTTHNKPTPRLKKKPQISAKWMTSTPIEDEESKPKQPKTTNNKKEMAAASQSETSLGENEISVETGHNVAHIEDSDLMDETSGHGYDAGNANLTPEYAGDILANMRARERSLVINVDYMEETQTSVTWQMRRKVVDWLVGVQLELRAQNKSLFSAVQIIDMYLLKVDVPRKYLQLLGATAMLIATKYDDCKEDCTAQLHYLADGAFTEGELLNMERVVLETIQFQLFIPSRYDFLRLFAKCNMVPIPRYILARFIIELSLLDERFMRFLASKVAAACLWLAFKMTEPIVDWNERAREYCGYEEKELMEIAVMLNDMLLKAPNRRYKSTLDKYSCSELYRVTKIAPLSRDRLEQERNRCAGVTPITS